MDTQERIVSSRRLRRAALECVASIMASSKHPTDIHRLWHHINVDHMHGRLRGLSEKNVGWLNARAAEIRQRRRELRRR